MPLTLSAAPFIARMVEQSLEEIDHGVLEAAQCMGATKWQIVTRVLLVESVPSLLRGLSISLITILGYGHHRQRGRRGPGQHRIPVRLSALSDHGHVRHGGAADFAGVHHSDFCLTGWPAGRTSATDKITPSGVFEQKKEERKRMKKCLLWRWLWCWC